jgi:hypothetical protein
LTKQELKSAAQQRFSGRLHLYIYTDPESGSIAYSRHGDDRFSEFLFENRVFSLFESRQIVGSQPSALAKANG